MDFLFLSGAAAHVAEAGDDPALDEAHWAYMDRFADGMTARGPTLGPDRETWTGSLHVVDLPDADAARAFVDQEPYNRAGAYAEHVVRRFTNLLGRTMWAFAGGSGEPRFLVVAGAGAGITVPPAERLIVHGALHTLDTGEPAGTVLALEAPSREAVEALLGRPPSGVWISDWTFGGRR